MSVSRASGGVVSVGPAVNSGYAPVVSSSARTLPMPHADSVVAAATTSAAMARGVRNVTDGLLGATRGTAPRRLGTLPADGGGAERAGAGREHYPRRQGSTTTRGGPMPGMGSVLAVVAERGHVTPFSSEMYVGGAIVVPVAIVVLAVLLRDRWRDGGVVLGGLLVVLGARLVPLVWLSAGLSPVPMSGDFFVVAVFTYTTVLALAVTGIVIAGCAIGIRMRDRSWSFILRWTGAVYAAGFVGGVLIASVGAPPRQSRSRHWWPGSPCSGPRSTACPCCRHGPRRWRRRTPRPLRP